MARVVITGIKCIMFALIESCTLNLFPQQALLHQFPVPLRRNILDSVARNLKIENNKIQADRRFTVRPEKPSAGYRFSKVRRFPFRLSAVQEDDRSEISMNACFRL